MRTFWLALLTVLAFSQALVSAQTTVENWSIPVPYGDSIQGLTQFPAGGKPVPLVILVHGSGVVNRDGNAPPQIMASYFAQLADSLVARGIAVSRYDKRTVRLAYSLQAMEKFRFDQLVEDINAITRRAAKDPRIDRIFLAGHSQGGLLVTLADQAPLSGLITLSGTSRPAGELMVWQACSKDSISCSMIRSMVDAASKPLDTALSPAERVNLQTLSDWMRYKPLDRAREVQLPVLVIGGEADLQVPASDARALHEAFPQSSLRIFPKMNHVLKDASGEGENVHSYLVPQYPLSRGLAQAIAEFVLGAEQVDR